MSDEPRKTGLRRTWWLWPLLALGAVAIGIEIRAILSADSTTDEREDFSAEASRISAIARQEAINREKSWEADRITAHPIRNADGSWVVFIDYRKGSESRDLRISKDGTVTSYTNSP